MLLSKAILARDQVKGSQVDVIVQWDPERGIIISSDDDVIDKSDYTQRIPSMFSLQMGIRGEMASAYATCNSRVPCYSKQTSMWRHE